MPEARHELRIRYLLWFNGGFWAKWIEWIVLCNLLYTWERNLKSIMRRGIRPVYGVVEVGGNSVFLYGKFGKIMSGRKSRGSDSSCFRRHVGLFDSLQRILLVTTRRS